MQARSVGSSLPMYVMVLHGKRAVRSDNFFPSQDYLVCTRAGIVQIVTPDKSSLEEIQLSKIGNWQSCSRYSPCNGGYDVSVGKLMGD
jgi:hypothetical protein